MSKKCFVVDGYSEDSVAICDISVYMGDGEGGVPIAQYGYSPITIGDRDNAISKVKSVIAMLGLKVANGEVLKSSQ